MSYTLPLHSSVDFDFSSTSLYARPDHDAADATFQQLVYLEGSLVATASGALGFTSTVRSLAELLFESAGTFGQTPTTVVFASADYAAHSDGWAIGRPTTVSSVWFPVETSWAAHSRTAVPGQCLGLLHGILVSVPQSLFEFIDPACRFLIIPERQGLSVEVSYRAANWFDSPERVGTLEAPNRSTAALEAPSREGAFVAGFRGDYFHSARRASLETVRCS